MNKTNPRDTEPQIFLSVSQAAELSQVSVSTVRRWIKERVLKIYRAGKQIRIDRDDLIAFMRGTSRK